MAKGFGFLMILEFCFLRFSSRPAASLAGACHTRSLVHSARCDSGCVGVAIAEQPAGSMFSCLPDLERFSYMGLAFGRKWGLASTGFLS